VSFQDDLARGSRERRSPLLAQASVGGGCAGYARRVSADGIEIDDELVDRVMRSHGLESRSAAVDFALRQLVAEPLTVDEALGMRGSGWDVRPGAADQGRRAAP